MKPLRGTLLCDGSSDQKILHVIRWLLDDLDSPPLELACADPALFSPAVSGLNARARAAIDQEPCDILFVHRDAERCPLSTRKGEIQEALNESVGGTPYICIIPIRMSEAWFLFEETAIRKAANNPNGTTPLCLPPMSRMERLPDPKQTLYKNLRIAANLRGRHLQRFDRNIGWAARRVGELIEDYSPLRSLNAFQEFERDLRAFINRMQAAA